MFAKKNYFKCFYLSLIQTRTKCTFQVHFVSKGINGFFQQLELFVFFNHWNAICEKIYVIYAIVLVLKNFPNRFPTSKLFADAIECQWVLLDVIGHWRA